MKVILQNNIFVKIFIKTDYCCFLTTVMCIKKSKNCKLVTAYLTTNSSKFCLKNTIAPVFWSSSYYIEPFEALLYSYEYCSKFLSNCWKKELSVGNLQKYLDCNFFEFSTCFFCYYTTIMLVFHLCMIDIP